MRKNDNRLPSKLAQDMRKSLRFVVKESYGVYVFGDFYGVLLSEQEYQEFAVKWGNYKGNVLPPLQMEPGERYEWFRGSETWCRTGENRSFSHLIEVPTEASSVAITSFILDDSGNKCRLVRLEDGYFQLIDEDYYQLSRLVVGKKLLHVGKYQYKKVDGDGRVTMVLMGIRNRQLTDILQKQLGVVTEGDS